MLLGGDMLRRAIQHGIIVVHRNGAQISDSDLVIGTNSIDVTLGRKFIKVRSKPPYPYIDPWEQDSLFTEDYEADKWLLGPGETILGVTCERFDVRGNVNVFGEIVDIAPMYDGRSTCGRLFLASHITAGYGDVGFKSAWTLELKNMGESSLLLRSGMRIGQVSFQVVLEAGAKYQGAYTDQHDGPKAPVLGIKRF